MRFFEAFHNQMVAFVNERLEDMEDQIEKDIANAISAKTTEVEEKPASDNIAGYMNVQNVNGCVVDMKGMPLIANASPIAGDDLILYENRQADWLEKDFEFDINVQDGDIVYKDEDTEKWTKTILQYGGARTRGSVKNTKSTTGSRIADVTRNKIYGRDYSAIPENIRKIAYGHLEDGYVYQSPIDGKWSNTNPMITNNVEVSVSFTMLDGKPTSQSNPDARYKKSTKEVVYEASEGEDVSEIINLLLLKHESVKLRVSNGIHAYVKENFITLNTGCNLSIDMRDSSTLTFEVRQITNPYSNTTPYHVTSGIRISGGKVLMGGTGTIEHIVASGTQLYYTPNQLLAITNDVRSNANIYLGGYSLHIYTTVGLIGINGNGGRGDVNLQGIKLHAKRNTDLFPKQNILAQGSWSHHGHAVSYTNAAVGLSNYNSTSEGLHTSGLPSTKPGSVVGDNI